MPEPLDFYLSYARSNNSPYLQKFFKDLTDELREFRPHGQKISFFDQSDIGLGTHWKQELLDALQGARTIVSIYSPAYFASEYCGKEWQVFQLRRRQFQQANQSAEEPPIIKPVLWVNLDEDVPPAVKAIQYKRGDPESVINKHGLLYVIKQEENFKTAYRDFIYKLASEIKETAKEYSVPSLSGALSMDQVESAFAWPAPATTPATNNAPQPPASRPQNGPKYVQFAFVAAKPDEFQATTRQEVDRYRDNGGNEWRPWTRRIGSVAQTIAANEDLEFVSYELPVGKDLQEQVRQAEEDRRLVVLLVDCWTAGIPHYQELLQKFDLANYFNCSVLIPWNEADPETDAKQKDLMKNLEDAFPFRATLPPSLHYRGVIRSEDDLRLQLRDVLIQLKAKVIKTAPPSRNKVNEAVGARHIERNLDPFSHAA